MLCILSSLSLAVMYLLSYVFRALFLWYCHKNSKCGITIPLNIQYTFLNVKYLNKMLRTVAEVTLFCFNNMVKIRLSVSTHDGSLLQTVLLHISVDILTKLLKVICCLFGVNKCACMSPSNICKYLFLFFPKNILANIVYRIDYSTRDQPTSYGIKANEYNTLGFVTGSKR